MKSNLQFQGYLTHIKSGSYNALTGHSLTERIQSQISKKNDEMEFLEWPFDFMRFRKIEIMCFCCGQLSSLAIFEQKHLQFSSCIVFKEIFFVEAQAERRALGPKNSQQNDL